MEEKSRVNLISQTDVGTDNGSIHQEEGVLEDQGSRWEGEFGFGYVQFKGLWDRTYKGGENQVGH